MAKIKPFHTGYFSIHNAVFDVMMPTLSPNAFKVLCVAIRQTLGWRRKSDQISYAQFKTLSGIKNNTTVNAALMECLEREYLVREVVGRSNLGTVSYAYRLNTALELDYTGEPSTENGLEPGTENGLEVEIPDFPSTETVLGPSTEIRLASTETVLGPSTEIRHTTIHKEHHHDDDAGSSLLIATQKAAAAALEAQGVTRSVAARLATRCAPELIGDWIAHVETRAGLKSPAAFLVAVLKRGDPPPVVDLAADDPQRYVTGAYADLIQH